MINSEYNTAQDTQIDFRFFILEPCYSFKVNRTLKLIEKMFGNNIFKSATLILKDCDHGLIPKNQQIEIRKLAFDN